MSLSPGSRLGSYEVTALIGSGGMGEVYRARDTKLGRDVALKVLPDVFADDPERLARFQREARVLASLNHPNIASIYGLEESGDTRALVLELVEGPTLAERIAQGAIPIDEALPIARQIAEALEAAHEAGVIHRDLKPANVKVKADGMVKVLDFGLAKALEGDARSDPSESPTMTAAATRMGVIMGTAAYMSPEQARGKPLDRRTDIWSFGCVLYEILTGRGPFLAETLSDTIARILDREPELETLPANTPAPLRRLLRRCLDKDPKERLRDIGDARVEIREAMVAPWTDGQSGEAAQPPAVGGRWVLPWVAGIALAVTTGVAVWSLVRPAPRSPVRLTVTVPASDRLYFDNRAPSVTLSPDGQTLVYAASRDGVRQLYRRPLDQLNATPIPGTEGARYPFFAPDGESLGFEVDGALKRQALTGGAPVTVYDGSDDAGTEASWSVNDTIIFGRLGGHGLLQVDATGGVAQPVTTLMDDEFDHSWPEPLPGGRGLLFTYRPPASNVAAVIAVQSLETGERRVLLEGTYPRYAPTGHLVFARGETMWAVPFDEDRLEVTGDPVPVVEGVTLDRSTGLSRFSFSRDGTLVYRPVDRGSEVGWEFVWVDRQGNEESVGAEPRAYNGARLSPDERYVLTDVADENRDIFIYDLERDILTRLTFDPAADIYPVWTPDGDRVVFSSMRAGLPNLYSRSADGTGQVERLTTADFLQIPSSFSPDGATLTVAESHPGTGLDVSTLSMVGEGQTEMLLQTEFAEGYATLSPDGRWLAYMSDESGQREIYVRPYPNLDGGRWQISSGGGDVPLWGRDGREVFFLRRDGTSIEVVVAEVDTEPTFSPGNPTVLFEKPYDFPAGSPPRPYDISDDGQRFLMLKPAGAEVDEGLVVVLNWFQELTERVPVN